ncbi:MAG: PAS domain S-box protein [Anaerolineales bacterium]|nr:PAS domain S-box protein [Anaerolineales bacterium]
MIWPVRLEDGGKLWYSASVKDITERKQAEEVLRKSEDRFRSLFENAPVGVLLVDPQGNVLEVNPSALQILGSPSAEATRQINMLNFPPLIDAGITADFQQCVQTAQLLSSEHPYTTKWGKSINLNLRFAPLVDTKGDLQLLQILIEDVSARKEAEQALEESQSRFRALFEDSPIAIWEEDFSQVKKHVDSLKQNGVSDFRAYFASHPDEIMKCAMMFNILNVNSAALRMYQAANKEDLIQNTIPVLSVGELEHIHEDLLAIAEGRTSNGWDGGDDTLTGKPIQISLTWSVVPGYEHDYSKVVVTTVDITERKQAEELIRQYTDELELRVEERTVELVQANRAKDEFLANMSHELRTPLNGILGFSETLLEGVRGPLNERQGQALEIIQSSGQHLLGLINDILDVAKIESGKFELQLETLVVNDICNSSLNFIKQMAVKKSISVEYSSRPASSTLIADPKRLKQILVNLLNNAVKFTPEKGRVKLDVLADAETGLMRFSVTDTGIGIAPEDQRKLFQPFVQVDSSLSRQYEGTGLGLMLVKKLVEMHNGSVEMKSEPGNGSCFTFTLPWSEEVQEKHTQSLTDDKEKSMAPGLGSAKRTHTKILLAEDNEANVTAIMDYLEFHGYEVTVAHDGREVFSKAEKMLPDIVLMDIQMPNVNGFEATRRLRSDPRFATVPIIALTAFAMSGDRERCLAAGMNEYLSKPVKLKELQQMIERFLENPLG